MNGTQVDVFQMEIVATRSLGRNIDTESSSISSLCTPPLLWTTAALSLLFFIMSVLYQGLAILTGLWGIIVVLPLFSWLILLLYIDFL